MLRRTVMAFIGLVFLAVAVPGLLAASWVWSTFGSAGIVSEPLGRLTGSPTSQAIVIDVERVGGEIPYLPVTGEAGLIATPAVGAPGPPKVFIAEAPAPVADEYLSGARYDVGRYAGGAWTLTPVPGFRDLDPPQDTAWQRNAIGPSARLALETGQPTTVVVMNADGSPPVDVLLTLQLEVPDSVTIALVLAVIGLVTLVIGLLFVRAAVGRGRERGVHEATSP